MMKTPVVLVAVALTVAILLTASLLIATRGEQSKAVIGELRPQHLTMSSPAKAGDPVFQRRQ
jgi:hypothetical protein